MSNNERAALRERAVVYDEITNDTHRAPLTLEQLRQRLKHIAGLCWGLSIDINNEFARNEALQKENKRLQDEINGLRAELKLVRNRKNARGIYRQKTAVKSKTESNAATSPAVEQTPDERKEAQKKYKREYMRKRRGGSLREEKLNAKLATMTPEEREKYLKQLEAKRKYNARYLAKKRAAQGGNND